MVKIIFRIFLVVTVLATGNQACRQQDISTGRWTKEQAADWYKSRNWMIGCNFIPSTAVNQLEMWQAETFDTITINRELGWAEAIGFNTVRVFLHHLAWEQDSDGFKNRLNKYLSIADRYHIGTIFVLFDDCWNSTYRAGKQPDPKLGIHNSQWVQDPGELLYQKPELIKELERYVKDIIGSFATDQRVILWDLYNEPGNSGYDSKSLPLLKKVFEWARTVHPSQPLSAGVWNYKLTGLNSFQVENSDVITYHNYENDSLHQKCIDSLRIYGRPLICTEYMRRNISRFDNITPLLKKENIGAINWGLVSGKTNTIFAWDTPIPDGSEPKLWFHDIFRRDGTPYKPEEVELIKKLTDKNK